MLDHFMKKMRAKITTAPPPEEALEQSAPPSRPVAPPGAPATAIKQPFAPIAPPQWRPNEIVLDHYRIETAIDDPAGEGGRSYGCRHIARDFQAMLEVPPARLLTTPAGLHRIIRRAEQRIRLGMHPNLAASFNLRFADRTPVMISERVAGESLENWLTGQRGGNSLRIDLSLAIQLCHGLEHCHQLGLIHGRLTPAAIMITPGSLLKVTGFGLTAPHHHRLEDDRQLQPLIAEDIRAFGRCLWRLLCGVLPATDPADPQRPGKPQPADPSLTFPVPLQVALLKSAAHNPVRGYRNFAELRRDLNRAYRELFKISCPYAEAPQFDYRAEILNNQAVMLLDEGKKREAARKLARSLEINDTLPEAVYNNLLFRWRFGKNAPARILRCIEASRQPGREQPALLELEQALTSNIAKLKNLLRGDHKGGPEFRLVPPPERLKIYRQGAERHRLQEKISDHLRQRRYQACHTALLEAWRREGFRKERFFNRIYEELLLVREKSRPLQAQRFLQLNGHRGPVVALACIPNSRRIAAIGQDGRIIIHDLGAGGKPELAENHELPATCLAVCPGGRHLAVGSADGGVHLLSPRSGNILGQEQSHRGAVTALTFSHDGKLLASGGLDGSIIVRRLSTGREDAVSLVDSGPIRALLFPGGSPELVSGSEDGAIRCWKSRLRECTATIEAHAGPLTGLAAAGRGDRLISAGADHRIRIWERNGGKCQQTLKGHEEPIRSILAAADGNTLISAGEDGLILVWNLQEGERLFSLDGRGDGVFSLAPGPRPHTFLAGRADGTINVWMLIYQLNFDLI